MKPLIVINGDGEIVTQDYQLKHKNQVKAIDKIQREEKAKRVGRSTSFTFTVMEILHEVTSVLTNAQLGYLFVLQGYVDYEGCLSVSGTPLKVADMLEILMLESKRRTFHAFMSKAIEHNILIKKDGNYFVNDRYHFKGKLRTKAVVKSFSKNVRQAYRDNIPEDLGLMYRLLPFVHLKTNVLCSNPKEQDPSKVETLKAKELADILGITPTEFSRRYRRWKFAGEYVMIMWKKGDMKGFILNPYIIRRDATDPDDTLKTLFRAK